MLILTSCTATVMNSQNELSLTNPNNDDPYSSTTCDDFEKNGDEQDVDCGGSKCAPCENTGIVDSQKRTSVAVFPNPSTGPFKFQSNAGELNLIELYSQNGQLLFTSGSINRKDANVDLSSLKAQTIMARIFVDGRTIQKILVKR